MRAETLAAILRSIEQTGTIDFDLENKRCNDISVAEEITASSYSEVFLKIMQAVGQRQRELQMELSREPATLGCHPLFNLEMIDPVWLGSNETHTNRTIAAIHCLLPNTLNTLPLWFSSFGNLENDGIRFFQDQHAVQTLTLKCNGFSPFQDYERAALAQILDRQIKLRDFTLAGSRMVAGSNKTMPPSEGLMHCKLESLHLQNIRMGARDIDAWQRVFIHHRETLKAITLDQCWITPEGITTLLQPLHDSPVLTGLTLNLNQDDNTDHTLQRRDEIIRDHKINVDRVTTLLNVVSTCPSLSTLVVSDNSLIHDMDSPQPPKNNHPQRINDAKTESMDTRLAKTPQEGLTWLLRTLSTQHIPLQKLDLQENMVSLNKDSAQLLSDFLKNTHTLRQLNLYITACEAGANPFEGLAKNTSLQELNVVLGQLVRDDILSKLLLALFEALNENQTLRIFSLNACGAEDLGQDARNIVRDRVYEQLVTHRSLQGISFIETELLSPDGLKSYILLLTALCFNTSLLECPEFKTDLIGEGAPKQHIAYLIDFFSKIVPNMLPRNKKLAQQRSALLKLAPLIAHTRANFGSPFCRAVLPLLQPSNTGLTIANFIGRSRTASGRSMNETEQACYKHLWRIFSYAILYIYRYRNSSTPHYQLFKSLIEAMIILLEENLLTFKYLRNTMMNGAAIRDQPSKTPIEQASINVVDSLQRAALGNLGNLAVECHRQIMQHAKCVLDLLNPIPSTHLHPASDQHTCTAEQSAPHKWPGPG